MTTPTPPPPVTPEDQAVQIEDTDIETLTGEEVEYDFSAPDPEDG